MHRVAFTATLVAATLVLAGCADGGSHKSSPTPVHTMPTVTAEPMNPTHVPMSSDELAALAEGSVSGAVDALHRHGYTSDVVDSEGNPVPQRQWDFQAVTDLTVDGDDARITVG